MKQQELPQSLSSESIINDIRDYNDTFNIFPDHCIFPDLFYQQVRAVPQNIAIIEKDRRYTYLELDDEVNRLLEIIYGHQLRKGSAIIILLEPGFQLLAAMLAVLKSGCYYVPVDVKTSVTHVHYMVADSNPSLILTSNSVYIKYSFSRRVSVCLVDDVSSTKENGAVEIEDQINVEDTAYVMYTSGTSGRPKRVAISQQSLVNYCFWAKNQYCNGIASTFPLITSVSFDLTITSLFVPLISGGTIIVYTGNEEETPVLQAIKDNKADIIKLTPSQLLSVANSAIVRDQYFNSNLKAIIVGGEDLSAKLCHEISRLFGRNIKIYNEYGPTEATVGCMIYEFDIEHNITGLIPVGKPISNSRIYLLDDALNLIGKDKVGEIYIAGKGLAKGYIDNPKMNSERFVPDIFVKGERMYKSGDLGRWNKRGELECLGRLERQLIVDGCTIMLAEIENVIETHDAVISSFVSIQKTSDNNILDIYVIPNESGYLVNQDKTNLLKKELLLLLNNLQPNIYMKINFIFIKNFPLNLNGKIAVDKLPIEHV